MSDIPNPDPQSPASDKVAGGLAPSTAAGIACIFTIISGVIFLVIEKKNQFVRFWAMQAVLLGLLSFAAMLVFAIAHVVLGHMPFIGGLMTLALILLRWAFYLVWFAAYLISIVKAFSNQEWEIPWLGKIARAQLAKMNDGSLPPVPPAA